jgi:hypothetical protein
MARFSAGLTPLSTRKLTRAAGEPIPAGSLVSLTDSGLAVQAQRDGRYIRRRIIGVAVSEAEVAGQSVVIAMSTSRLQLADSIAQGTVIFLSSSKGEYDTAQSGGVDNVVIGIVGASNVLNVDIADVFFESIEDDGLSLDALWTPAEIDASWFDFGDGASMDDGAGGLPGVGSPVEELDSQNDAKTLVAVGGATATRQFDGMQFTASEYAINGDRSTAKPLHDGTGGALFLRVQFTGGNGVNQFIYDDSNVSSSATGFSVGKDTNNKVWIYIANGTGTAMVNFKSSEDLVVADGWVDLVVDVGASGGSVWIDGVEETFSFTGSPDTGDSDNPVVFGRRSTANDMLFQGLIRAAAFKSAVSTADERSNWSDYFA